MVKRADAAASPAVVPQVVVNQPPPPATEESSGSKVGVAIVIIVLLAIAGILGYFFYRFFLQKKLRGDDKNALLGRKSKSKISVSPSRAASNVGGSKVGSQMGSRRGSNVSMMGGSTMGGSTMGGSTMATSNVGGASTAGPSVSQLTTNRNRSNSNKSQNAMTSPLIAESPEASQSSRTRHAATHAHGDHRRLPRINQKRRVSRCTSRDREYRPHKRPTSSSKSQSIPSSYSDSQSDDIPSTRQENQTSNSVPGREGSRSRLASSDWIPQTLHAPDRDSKQSWSEQKHGGVDGADTKSCEEHHRQPLLHRQHSEEQSRLKETRIDMSPKSVGRYSIERVEPGRQYGIVVSRQDVKSTNP